MNKFLLLVLALANVAGAASGSSKLEQYCRGDPIELNKVGDIVSLITALRANPVEGCTERARNAVLDLEPIIKADNVCSVEVAKRIGRYYEMYVSKKGIIRHRKLSKSIKEYFFAVGFKISKLCDKSLLVNLQEVSKERVTEADSDVLLNYNQNMRNLVKVVGGHDSRIEDLFLVTNMDGIEAKKSNNRAADLMNREVVVVNAKTKKQIDQIKALCRNKFKPVYEKLISPLVILTNVGFDYTSGDVQELKSKFKQGKLYSNWFAAVLICESTLGLKMIEIPKSDNIDSNAVTILDDQDLAKLNGEGVKPEFELEAAADVPQEYNVSVKLQDWTNLKHDELLGEVKTISKKRREAKSSRKQALKRLEKMLLKLAGAKEFKVGLEGEEAETGIGEPKTRASIADSAMAAKTTDYRPERHWKKRAFVVLGFSLIILGAAFCPLLTFVGMLIVVSMFLVRLEPDHDDWH